MTSTHNHALVFGASGITGWAITRLILEGFPTTTAFDSVTALTNRPLSRESALLPDSPKLDIVSGIDIMTERGEGGFENDMKAKIKHLSKVTHVYFFAYVMDLDAAKEVAYNREMLSRAIKSVDKLSPNLKFVILPSGTKAYGVHLLNKFPFPNDLPLKETLPRIPEPYASQMFYYGQADELAELSKGKSWTWAEIIPDMIVGFVPQNNIYSLAQWLGLYLSLCREMYGEGAEVVFPGADISWKNLCNDSSQDIVAKVSIIASLKPEESSGQRFNAADDDQPSTWSQKWPIVCQYFNLKGVGPKEGISGPDPVKFLADNLSKWKEVEQKNGLVTGRVGNERSFGGFPTFIMTMLNFDRQVDMTKTHSMMGEYKEIVDTKTAWYKAFDLYRKAKIIP